ncbi:MAG TPA: TrmH family RNA methyltransferase [Streptosporangiaceae bacterium]
MLAAGAALDYALYPAGPAGPKAGAAGGPAASGADEPVLRAALERAGVPAYPVREGLLRKVTGTARPPGWLAVAALPAEAGPDEPYGDFAVVCERVADAGNLGTIVRTARALGVRDVVLTDEQTDLSSRRVLEAARGAVLGCRVRRFAGPAAALAALREAGFQIVVTSPRGAHLQSTAPLRGQRVALVAGNETDGVSAATVAAADLVVQIPMAAAVESLNVGVATGIGVYELRMRMILAMLTDRIRGTLGRNLAVATQLARQAFGGELREITALSSDQAVLLMVLSCERSTPLGQLRRDLGVDAAELTALLAPLRDQGYLTTTQDTDTQDGATQDTDTQDIATISRDGEQAVAALWAVQERAEEVLYAGFTPAERDQLLGLLRRVQQNAARAIARDGTAGDGTADEETPG